MADEPLHCLVEIPKGSRNKYEWDEELQAITLRPLPVLLGRLSARLRDDPRHAGRGRRPARRDGGGVRADVPRLRDPGQADRAVQDARRQGDRRQGHLRPAPGPQLEQDRAPRGPAPAAARRDLPLLRGLQDAGGQDRRGRRLVPARGRDRGDRAVAPALERRAGSEQRRTTGDRGLPHPRRALRRPAGLPARSPTTARPTACAWRTSTRATARPSCCSTASRRGRSCGAR